MPYWSLSQYLKHKVKRAVSHVNHFEEAVAAEARERGFDGVVQCAPWLAHIGDSLYTLALRLNRALNSARARLGLPYWSLSRYLKLKVKRAVSFIGDFEAAVIREARRRGVDGVVCGHIHHAELRTVDGLTYANDGDWVESLSALVEHADGRLELLHWRPAGHGGQRLPEPRAAELAPA